MVFAYEQSDGYRLQIKKRDGSETYYTFDSLDSSPQAINVFGCKLNLNSAMSSLEFSMEDSQKTIDRTLIRSGVQVTLQIAKTSDFYANPDSYAFVGYVDFPSPVREATNVNDIRVQCYEVKKGFYDTRMVYQRTAPLSVFTNPSSQSGNNYTAKVHLRKMITDKNNMVLGDISLKDRFGLDESGISDNLSVVLPNVVYNYNSVGDAFDDISAKIGSIWYLDYRGGAKKVRADYTYSSRVPIILKNGPAVEALLAGDNPKRTSYIADGFELPSTSSVNSGHASRLFGVTRIDKHIVASSETATAFTSLTNKAISMPFTTNEVKFNGLNFIVSKRGDPQSPKSRINGAIFTGKVVGSLNIPDQQIAEWHVPIDDIEKTKTNVTINIEDIKTKALNNSTTTFHIVWYQRSGNEATVEHIGDPNTDENNTILLYRDNSTNGGSLIAAGGDRDAKLTWKANGPKYAFNITSALNRVFAVTNYTEADKIGFVEAEPQDLNDIDSVSIATRYMTNLLYYTSLYKAEPQFKVTNPNDFIFRPYQVIRVVDTLSAPTGLDFEIHDVTYDFQENTNEVTIGGITFIDEGWLTNWPCTNVL